MAAVRAPTYRVDKNPDMDAGLGNFIVECGYQTSRSHKHKTTYGQCIILPLSFTVRRPFAPSWDQILIRSLSGSAE